MSRVIIAGANRARGLESVAAMVRSSNKGLAEVVDRSELPDILEEPNGQVLVLLALNDASHDELAYLMSTVRLGAVVVALLGHESPDSVRECFRNGACDVLRLPGIAAKDVEAALERARRLVSDRSTSRRTLEDLRRRADWQFWKAQLLSRATSNDLEQVLEMLHIQFNQDCNYPAVERVLLEEAAPTGTVKLGRDLARFVREGIAPVARFAKGIGIAKRVVNCVPTKQCLTVSEFNEWLKDLGETRLSPLASVRNHDFELWQSPASHRAEGWIEVDRSLLGDAIEELVINAMKYSESGDPVRVMLDTTNDRLLFNVLNPARGTTRKADGTRASGIPEDLEQAAMQYFVRFSIDTSANWKELWPMGLGLPLVRQVFELHGGKFGIRNETWHLSFGKCLAPSVMVTARGELPISRIMPISASSRLDASTIYDEAEGAAVGTSNPSAVDVDGLELF